MYLSSLPKIIQIVVSNRQANKCKKTYTGPYTIIEIPPQSGNAISHKGHISECVNIRIVPPFIE